MSLKIQSLSNKTAVNQQAKYTLISSLLFGTIRKAHPLKFSLQTSTDGNTCEIKDVSSSSYLLSVDDIGFLVSVSCEPVRTDWARGPMVLSEHIGPIVAGNVLKKF